MMKNILLLLIVSFLFTVNFCSKKPEKKSEIFEKRLRIAVFDTGISDEQLTQDYMCKDVAAVPSISKFNIKDHNGHGTNIISIISENLDTSKYCITSYTVNAFDSLQDYLLMLEKVKKHKPFLVNISWASTGAYISELNIFKEMTNSGIIVNVSAGNNAKNLDENCDVYPACYKFHLNSNFYVIGSTNKRYTNTGNVVDTYIDGDDIGFPKMTGTSQSTARFSRLLTK
jgi:hypothetical protein